MSEWFFSNFKYRKKELTRCLDVVVVVITMRELVGVVPLVLVHDCDSVSDEMVHTIMAGACAHLRHSE